MTRAEVIEILKKLHSGKALRVDENHLEFLKAVEVAGLSSLALSGGWGKCCWIGRLG